MDIRIILAVLIAAALLALAWLFLRLRNKRAGLAEEAQLEWDASDRIASERLTRLAAARRDVEGEEAEAQQAEQSWEDVDDISSDDLTDIGGLPGEEAAASLAEEDAAEPAAAADQAATGNAWTAILYPAVPIDRSAPRSSWLGGRPHLPFGTEWPAQDGIRLTFLAGIALETLPSDLWDGIGPRDGWLLIFLNPGTQSPHCLWVDAIGPGEDERPDAFAIGDTLFDPFGGFGADIKRGSRIPRCFAEWPVSLELKQQTGDVSALLRGPIAPPDINFDFSDPALYPIDEFSTLAMLEVINDDFAEMEAVRYPDTVQEIEDGRADIERLRNELAATLEQEKADPGKAGTLREELALAEAQHRALVSEFRTNSDAGAHLRQLVQMVRDHAGKSGLKRDEIGQIMAGLAEVPVAWRRETDVLDTPNAEAAEIDERPLTCVTAGDPHPGASLIGVAAEHAKQAYTRRPEVFTPEQEAFWTRYFASHARRLGRIGGAPGSALADFDAAQDVLLLELENSQLVGWNFGAGEKLAITMTKDDLRAGEFGKASVHIIGN